MTPVPSSKNLSFTSPSRVTLHLLPLFQLHLTPNQDASVAFAQIQQDLCYTFAALNQSWRRHSFDLKRGLYAKAEQALFTLVRQILKEGDIDEPLKDIPDFLQQPAKRQRSHSPDSFGPDPLLSVSPVSSTSNFTAAVKNVSTAASALIVKPVTSILANPASDIYADLGAFLQSSGIPDPIEDPEFRFDDWTTEFNHFYETEVTPAKTN